MIPESPSWLFNNGQDVEGIKVLNYISKFNGSSKIIPLNAKFDVLGQVIKQNKMMQNNKDGILKTFENKSMISSLK